MAMKTNYQQAQCPIILRYHRLMDVFTKSNDERDFYLDLIEGFLIFVDLDKDSESLTSLEKELESNPERYALIPKMTFFEIKKFMEGFVNEKVYDIDVKEKLLDIISAKDPRENFLEFIYDHLIELEKWQQYYQEKSRIKVIEWLRQKNVNFVFEEDLDLTSNVVEKLKRTLFDAKVSKDLVNARTILEAKARTYYSNEALNPRPKRGRPPKQQEKIITEPQFTVDIYITVNSAVRPFLYIPEFLSAASVTFSSKFETEEKLLASLKGSNRMQVDEKLEALIRNLESLNNLPNSRLKPIDQKSMNTRRPHDIVSREKISEKKKVELAKDRGEKVEEAASAVFKTKTEEVEEGEAEVFKPQKRKQFAVKKVSQIKRKRPKN